MSGTSKIAYLILTAVIGYTFIYPSVGDVNALMTEKQKYEDSLEMVSNIETKKNELLEQYNSIPEEDRKQIDVILPSSFDFVKMVYQIDTVAAKYGISIDDITSKEIDSSGSDAVGSRDKLYTSSAIGFSFSATYGDFQHFMADLEKSLRILDIKSLKVNTDEKGIYKYQVEFKTYWLK